MHGGVRRNDATGCADDRSMRRRAAGDDWGPTSGGSGAARAPPDGRRRGAVGRARRNDRGCVVAFRRRGCSTSAPLAAAPRPLSAQDPALRQVVSRRKQAFLAPAPARAADAPAPRHHPAAALPHPRRRSRQRVSKAGTAAPEMLRKQLLPSTGTNDLRHRRPRSKMVKILKQIPATWSA